MEQSVDTPTGIKRVFVGIGKAADSVPAWHAEKFMKLYDRFYYSGLTREQKKVTDRMRPVIEQRAKALGWIATGIEAAAVTYAAAKGYALLKERSARGPVRGPEPAAHLSAEGTVTATVSALPKNPEPIPHADAMPTLYAGQSPITTESLEHVLDSKQLPVTESLDHWLHGAPEAVTGSGPDTLRHRVQEFDHNDRLVSIYEQTDGNGNADFTVSVLYRKNWRMVFRAVKDNALTRVIGYLFQKKADRGDADAWITGSWRPADDMQWHGLAGWERKPAGLFGVIETAFDHDHRMDAAARTRLAEIVKRYSTTSP